MKPSTVGELRASGYQPLSIKEEMRRTLIGVLQRGEALFPGVIGYEETVVPQIENALLSGHDLIFLGERGQAKTRIMRSLVRLLSPEIPVLKGCEINDEPFRPVCRHCRIRVIELGDRAEVEWRAREDRYTEKLATPDVSIADLIGEVDPIKIAEGKYLSDELAIHFGLIPRAHRGIFAINELPDLPEKVQVGLFNLMEERDVQIKGYRVRLPLDLCVVASANPEDYTNRGRIITPLKDRFSTLVRTHYPAQLEQEMQIMDQERRQFETRGLRVTVPKFMKEMIAEITFLARKSRDVSQRSGVSVRMSIANIETLVSSAEKRALRLSEPEAVPRVSDLESTQASSAGKVELEYGGEERTEGEVLRGLLQQSVKNIFDRRFEVDTLQDVVRAFDEGMTMETGVEAPASDLQRLLERIPELKGRLLALGLADSPAQLASGVELVLEGLYLHRKLSKESLGGGKAVFRT